MFLKIFKNKQICEGGICHQVLMTILINIPLVSFGLTMGWLSPNTLVLQGASGPSGEPLSDEVISWMASVTFLAAFPAVLLYWYAVDVMGRKFALICTSVPFAICWALKLYSHEPWALITARAVAGLGSSGCFIVVPLYVKEISQDSVRGALGSVLVLAQNFGYLMVYVMSDFLAYRAVLWTCLMLPLAHIFIFVFMPESPSFLMAKGHVKDAAKALAWLRRRNLEDKEITEGLRDLKTQEIKGLSDIKKLFTSIVSDPAKFSAFRISLIIILAQEVCGLFTLVMFAGSIFEAAGLTSITPNQQIIVLGVVQLAGSVIASSLVERVGRKRLLYTGGYFISCCMLALAVWFYLNSVEYSLPRWLPAVAMCLAIFCDSAGLQPVPYVIMSEMFSFELRGMVATVIMGITDIANFAELKVFHPIINVMGMHTCFFIFTVISFSFSTYVVFCVPETMGRSVDEILDILRKDKKEEFRQDDDKNKGEKEERKFKNDSNERNVIDNVIIFDIQKKDFDLSKEGIIINANLGHKESKRHRNFEDLLILSAEKGSHNKEDNRKFKKKIINKNLDIRNLNDKEIINITVNGKVLEGSLNCKENIKCGKLLCNNLDNNYDVKHGKHCEVFSIIENENVCTRL